MHAKLLLSQKSTMLVFLAVSLRLAHGRSTEFLSSQSAVLATETSVKATTLHRSFNKASHSDRSALGPLAGTTVNVQNSHRQGNAPTLAESSANIEQGVVQSAVSALQAKALAATSKLKVSSTTLQGKAPAADEDDDDDSDEDDLEAHSTKFQGKAITSSTKSSSNMVTLQGRMNTNSEVHSVQAGHANSDKEEQWKELFSEMIRASRSSSDDSGMIDVGQLDATADMLKEVGIDYPGTVSKDTLDRDGDAKISWDEWLSTMQSKYTNGPPRVAESLHDEVVHTNIMQLVESPVLTDSEKEEQWKDLFDEVDKDGDGSIDYSELDASVTGLHSLGIDYPDAFTRDDIDPNGDGKITWDEWKSAMGSKYPDGISEENRDGGAELTGVWKQLFNDIHKDGNGAIERAELDAVKAKLVDSGIDVGGHVKFEDMDTDGNGKIAWDEWKSTMTAKYPDGPPDDGIQSVQEQRWRDVFESIHTNDRNGIVTPEELKAGKEKLSAAGIDFPGHVSEADLNPNGDHSITWHRFHAVMKGKYPKGPPNLLSVDDTGDDAQTITSQKNPGGPPAKGSGLGLAQASSSMKRILRMIKVATILHGNVHSLSKDHSTSKETRIASEAAAEVKSKADGNEPSPSGKNNYGLSDDKIAEIKQAFTDLDKDGDGMLTKQDMGVAISGVGNFNPTDAELQEIMNEGDTDGDGKISEKEFIAMTANGMNDKDAIEEYKESFKVFDKDGSGFITHAELQLAMADLGDDLTDKEVDEMIRDADKDGDGQVNFEEFLAQQPPDYAPD